jgi:hypothetical protein
VYTDRIRLASLVRIFVFHARWVVSGVRVYLGRFPFAVSGRVHADISRICFVSVCICPLCLLKAGITLYFYETSRERHPVLRRLETGGDSWYNVVLMRPAVSDAWYNVVLRPEEMAGITLFL